MEIIEGNKLIAEYMESTFKSEYKIVNFSVRPTINIQANSFCEDELEYHKSWDWLMPVIEKIGNHTFDDVNEGEEPETAFLRTFHGNMTRINRFPLHQAETQIESTWKAVVEFIEFLNEDIK